MNQPSLQPQTKYLDWPVELVNLAKKQEAIEGIRIYTETLIEELFFHIYRFEENELNQGSIPKLAESDLENGYNICKADVSYFNILIKIINNLFYISRKDSTIKHLEITDMPENMLLVAKIATGSADSELFANLVAIVNEVNRYSILQPSLSINKQSINKFIEDDSNI
jgi:hypothetical protein